MRIVVDRRLVFVIALATALGVFVALLTRYRQTFAVLHRSGLYGTDWIGPWWYVLAIPVISIGVGLVTARQSDSDDYTRVVSTLCWSIELVLLSASIFVFVWNV